MKSNWQTKKLGEICKVDWGNTNLTKKSYIPNGKYLAVSAAGADGRIDHFEHKAGTPVLSAIGANCGAMFFPKEDFTAIKNTITLTPNSKDVDGRFLFNLFNFIKLPQRGAGQPFISKGDIESFEVSIPGSLGEQHRIVKILDEVFGKTTKAKENAEKNLQNAKELFESYLQSVFANPGKDWEEKKLEELGRITSSKRIFKKEYTKTGIPFYRIKEIKELANNKDISTELYITKSRYLEIKNIFGVPKQGDILMTAVGTIGEIYVVKKDEDFYFKDGNILWFKDFDSVNPYFLKFVLMSFVEKIKKLSKGSAYSALTIEKIEKHSIFIPKSITKQKSIVVKLDALSAETKKLEMIYKQKLADLEELKKSVLKSAFAGEF